MCRVCVPHAAELDAASLKESVSTAYGQVRRSVSRLGRHPIRFWNFVPAINDLMDGGLERYMVFNAGRFEAYTQWYGLPGAFGPTLATASAVGTTGADLVIYCLAADAPGEAIENPRQTPAWRYSSAYGPRPPCFARATRIVLDGRRLLLVGGTASIVGEASLHAGDPVAQTAETLANLARLIAAARDGADRGASLDRLADLRVYVRRAEDAALVFGLVRAACPALTPDIVAASICRPELLVEIEGVAEL